MNSIVLWSPKFVVQQIHLSRMTFQAIKSEPKLFGQIWEKKDTSTFITNICIIVVKFLVHALS
jgi:hypothetical protein